MIYKFWEFTNLSLLIFEDYVVSFCPIRKVSFQYLHLQEENIFLLLIHIYLMLDLIVDISNLVDNVLIFILHNIYNM